MLSVFGEIDPIRGHEVSIWPQRRRTLRVIGTLIEIPNNDTSHAVATWWPLLGTDERDFDSTCSHFGNETPESQKYYHRC